MYCVFQGNHCYTVRPRLDPKQARILNLEFSKVKVYVACVAGGIVSVRDKSFGGGGVLSTKMIIFHSFTVANDYNFGAQCRTTAAVAFSCRQIKLLKAFV